MDAADRVAMLERATVIRWRSQNGLVDDADFAYYFDTAAQAFDEAGYAAQNEWVRVRQQVSGSASAAVLAWSCRKSGPRMQPRNPSQRLPRLRLKLPLGAWAGCGRLEAQHGLSGGDPCVYLARRSESSPSRWTWRTPMPQLSCSDWLCAGGQCHWAGPCGPCRAGRCSAPSYGEPGAGHGGGYCLQGRQHVA